MIPIDLTNKYDRLLVDTLITILNDFLKTSTSVQRRYFGDRPNELGRRIEMELVDKINTSSLSVTRLGEQGYPDVEIKFENITTYMEVKTSAKRDGTDFRYFYYTQGKKIKSNARHLLLMIDVIKESKDGYWRIENWDLKDLFNLKVKLKSEFNASKKDMIKEARTLRSN